MNKIYRTKAANIWTKAAEDSARPMSEQIGHIIRNKISKIANYGSSSFTKQTRPVGLSSINNPV
jgi:hypothetical protein